LAGHLPVGKEAFRPPLICGGGTFLQKFPIRKGKGYGISGGRVLHAGVMVRGGPGGGFSDRPWIGRTGGQREKGERWEKLVRGKRKKKKMGHLLKEVSNMKKGRVRLNWNPSGNGCGKRLREAKVSRGKKGSEHKRLESQPLEVADNMGVEGTKSIGEVC